MSSLFEASFIFLNQQYIVKLKNFIYNQYNQAILTIIKLGCIISMQGTKSLDRKQCLRNVFLTIPIVRLSIIAEASQSGVAVPCN